MVNIIGNGKPSRSSQEEEQEHVVEVPEQLADPISSPDPDYAWTTDVDPNSNVDPELTESFEKEPSEGSSEGEAAALPIFSYDKHSSENWGYDAQSFALETNARAPSTSREEDRIASPETENRRIKEENRQRARERKPAAGTELKRFIVVPTEKIDRIIGKGGTRIKEIEKQTGAKIIIENRKSSESVTRIILTGMDDQISAADKEICNIVGN